VSGGHPESRAYRPDIDGLRAVAVISVVVEPLPQALLAVGFTSSRCPTVQRAAVAQRDAAHRALTRRVAAEFDEVRVVDFTDVLCETEGCTVFGDGRLLYSDPDHLSPAGATFVIERTWSQFGFDAVTGRQTPR